jgi:hypothetical protein
MNHKPSQRRNRIIQNTAREMQYDQTLELTVRILALFIIQICSQEWYLNRNPFKKRVLDRSICQMRDRLEKSFDQLFNNQESVELMRIGRVAEWFKWEKSGRLTLPPIQRSFVWRNEQILNYWDSLMRGYPAGMMMVTPAKRHGRGPDNRTVTLCNKDFQLFDGQQRLTALLLGLGDGSLCDSFKLWIDIGKPTGSGDRLYEFRINSTGQPFGYRSGEPNTKINADDRRAAQEFWPNQDEKQFLPVAPDVIFAKMAKDPIGKLSSAKCPVSLSFILRKLMEVGEEDTGDVLRSLAAYNAANSEMADIEDLLKRLHEAINAEIVVKTFDTTVLDERNYPRFFARLGQGGTRLSDDELVYSLIKDRYPYVNDRVDEIVKGAGKFTSEVDLVLAALRVSQALKPWPNSQHWEQIGRPTPDRVRQLHENGDSTTEPYFLSLLPEDKSAPPKLGEAIKCLREGLLFDAERNSCGLPSMLLARMPRDLLDVMLLFAFKRGETLKWNGEDRETLIAFALYWLLFVSNDAKAANYSFEVAQVGTWCFGKNAIAKLLRYLETGRAARHAPRTDDWPSLRKEVQERGSTLAGWGERFISRDVDGHANPGEALRILSTNRELIKRVLIWVQRNYVARIFPHYDPTSTRDDDLPFDLDHVFPKALFGANLTKFRDRIHLTQIEKKAFENQRKTVGDSLGNFRWLAAGDNRRRGKQDIEAELPSDGDLPSLHDHIDRPSWNFLINLEAWEEAHIKIFQKLIDCRTLKITENLMSESGITGLIDLADRE